MTLRWFSTASGGKVLVSTQEHIQRLIAIRLQAFFGPAAGESRNLLSVENTRAKPTFQIFPIGLFDKSSLTIFDISNSLTVSDLRYLGFFFSDDQWWPDESLDRILMALPGRCAELAFGPGGAHRCRGGHHDRLQHRRPAGNRSSRSGWTQNGKTPRDLFGESVIPNIVKACQRMSFWYFWYFLEFLHHHHVNAWDLSQFLMW